MSKRVQNKEENITEVLKKIAPGTQIRDGLENILRARTGALVLIADNNEVLKVKFLIIKFNLANWVLKLK